MNNAQEATLSMRKETLLVIYEFLSRSYDQWRESGKGRSDSLSDESFCLSKPDAGERVALWRLEGEIERTFPDIFSSGYVDLIDAEKRRLSLELYGSGNTQ